MLTEIDCEKTQRALEKKILDEFGELFYPDNNGHQHFRLTRVLIRDILADPTVEDESSDLIPRLLDADQCVHSVFAGRRLVRFTAVARFGRWTIVRRGIDPDFFIDVDTLLLASRLKHVVSHELETAEPKFDLP